MSYLMDKLRVDKHTDTQTDACNGNALRPKLASGKNYTFYGNIFGDEKSTKVMFCGLPYMMSIL